MLMSRQVTVPRLAVSLRLRSCATTGSRGGVGPATQTTSSVDVVEQAEVRAALPTGRCSVRCRLEQSARTLSSATAPSPSMPLGSTKRNEHVGAGVVGRRAVALLLAGAPARQAPDRVEQRLVDRAAVHRRRE